MTQAPQTTTAPVVRRQARIEIAVSSVVPGERLPVTSITDMAGLSRRPVPPRRPWRDPPATRLRHPFAVETKLGSAAPSAGILNTQRIEAIGLRNA